VPRVIAFLFALSASVSLFIHLYGLMSASRLPPGLGAAVHYTALARGWASDSLTFQEVPLYLLISFAMRVFSVDLLTALKLVPTFLLSVLPLLVYLLSLTLTGSRLVGVASAWIIAFMPAVTASLMVGNYSLILGLFLFTAYLSLLVKCLRSGSRAALHLALLASALTLPLLFLSTLGPTLIQGQVFRADLSVWTENLWLNVSMAVGVVVGIYTVLKRIKSVALPVLLALAIVPFTLVFIPALSSLHVLSTPILALLIASPLLWLRESFSVREVNVVDYSPIVELVIDLPKLAAIFLVALLTVSTVGVGYSVSASIYSEHSASRYFTDEEITSAVKWINGNMHGEATLCSKPVVAAWLEALSGKSFIGFRGLDEAIASEAIESTSFRILTPSLLVDEWEPFSTSKAPCISYYNGRRYEPIAYIDDSTVRVRLIKDGKEWVESPYRAAYRGYRWLSDTQPEVILVQHFETPGLLFKKTIQVSTSEQRVKVEYLVDPKTKIELVCLEFPVRVEPWKKARILETTNDKITLVIDGRETKISFSGNVVSLMHEEYDEGHVMIKAEFTPVGGAIEAKAVVSINSEERSQMPLWLAYTPELITNRSIEYVVAQAGTMGFLDRSLVDPVESLITKDSFNPILFDALGNSSVETPSSGKVRFDESSVDGVRLIGYKTDKLYINKSLTESERSIELRYAIAPTETSSSLTSMNLTIWIPWDILFLDHTIQGDEIKLKLGSGEFEVRFIGEPIHVEVGPDPEYGQNRVKAVLKLRSEGDEVGVNISSLKPLLTVMEAGDLTVCADTNLFRVVFKQGALVVCRTSP